MTERPLVASDINIAFQLSNTKLTTFAIPFGTDTGAVADAGVVKTVATQAAAASATANGAANSVASVNQSITSLTQRVTTVEQNIGGYVSGSTVTAQITTAIQGLASQTYVDTKVAGLTTASQLTAALQGYVSLQQFNSGLTPYATTAALTNALAPLATTAYVTNAVTTRTPPATVDSSGLLVVLPDGSKGLIAFTSTIAAPGGPTYALASGSTMIPNTFASIDAAITPVSQGTLTNGTNGMRVDSLNNVVELIEPVNKIRVTSGYGRMLLVTSGGPGGFPFFKGTSSTYNNSYESFNLPLSYSAPMFSPVGGTWAVIFVIRQTGLAANGLIRVDFPDGTHVYVTGKYGATDGSLHIEQNNGAAVGDENLPGLTGLNQWQIMEIICNGQNLAIYRNGTLTLRTPDGTIGGVNGNTTTLQFCNNPQAEVALIEVMIGNGSITQRNNRLGLLSSRYAITVNTITDGSATQVPPTAIDLTGTYLLTPNFPVSNTLPTRPGVNPGGAVVLANSSAQRFSLSFGSGQVSPNVLSTTDLYKYIYTNYIFGNQTNVLDPVGSTGTSNPPFYARARHYADGDVNNLHKVDSQGLHLSAIYSKNHTDGSYGNVYGAVMRLPPSFKPGCYLELYAKWPSGPHEWTPWWLVTGEQDTPGPGGNPYAVSGSIRTGNGGHIIEIDMDDSYPRPDTNTPVGQQLDFGQPDIYGVQWTGLPPHNVYHASSAGYTWFPNASPPHLKTLVDRSVGFHYLGFNWRNDGSNLMDIFLDGFCIQTDYMEFDQAQTYVDKNGITQVMGCHMILGNQAKATFTPGSDTAAEWDGGTIDKWELVVRSVSCWDSNVVNPNSYRPT